MKLSEIWKALKDIPTILSENQEARIKRVEKRTDRIKEELEKSKRENFTAWNRPSTKPLEISTALPDRKTLIASINQTSEKSDYDDCYVSWSSRVQI